MSSQNPAPARKLVAILFADIQGYTALMQDDEARANQILEKFHQTLQDQVGVAKGEVVNDYGDGCLCIFDSAVDAVRCALNIQKKLQQDPVVPVRIGLHSGDVMIKKDNVYGDSVNLASRIESLGVPGSILLSERIARDIKNQKDLPCISIGSFEFKNVDKPLEVFALNTPDTIVPNPDKITGKLKTTSASEDSASKNRTWIWIPGIVILMLAGWWYQTSQKSHANTNVDIEKSIAVLPFRNLSADEENQYFCDGVMDVVRNKISQIEGLTVIARGSVEQYRDSKKSIEEIATELNVGFLLQGSVQRAGNQVRIATELIDTKTKQQSWSNLFDGELSDIFRIQSEIAEKIASGLQIELTPTAKATLTSVATQNIKAYDMYLRGKEALYEFRFNQKDSIYNAAVSALKNSIAEDSTLALAYVALGNAYWVKNFEETYLEDDFMKVSKQYYDKALDLNNELPEAHAALGWYYLHNKEPQKFIEQQTAAIKLNESFADAYTNLGWYYGRFGSNQEYEKAIEFYKKALDLDPFSSNTIFYYRDLSWFYMEFLAMDEAQFYASKIRESGEHQFWNPLVHIHLVRGEYDQAEEIANEWLEHTPEALRYITEILINRDGDYVKAIELYEEYARLNPNEYNYRQRWGLAYILNGEREKGEQLMREAMEQFQRQIELRGVSTCYDIAGIHAALGAIDEAMMVLRDQECILAAGLEYYILIDPLFKNLWHLQEFQSIIKNRTEAKLRIRDQIRAKELMN